VSLKIDRSGCDEWARALLDRISRIAHSVIESTWLPQQRLLRYPETKINPAMQLLISRRFDEAVEAYRRQLQEDAGNQWPNFAGLAEALMASERYAEAIPIFEKVSDYESSPFPRLLGKQQQLCVCHWMIGDRKDALAIVKEWVIAVRDGRITFTDAAGGVTQGIILCYMAATLGVSADVDLAMRYLKKLATRQRIKYWPGPAALFLLGGLTFGEAMKDAAGFADLAEARKIAERDGMKRRYPINALFAAGTERRMAGDDAGCRMFMAECAGLPHPLVEYEWYLAKGEVAASV
jgi:tetratricopeptide (TPR) repeat protein